MDSSADAQSWETSMAPGLDVVEAIAIKAYAELPDEFRALSGEIRFYVADFPDDDVVREMELQSPFDILGLFEGRGIGDIDSPVTGEMPNRILLYRRPILDYWAEHEETLGTLVSHVLIHEIGHHFGLSDDDMEALEASVT
ncbi:metallopeptidase family protein [Aurantimonas sp. C2-6-R+9]|uniref:metallopeptidase family protein n=1 Tax=unclassified Aurantimonas TaxID=2638230 RepID=UPI002E186BCB|nr:MULTISPECIES: metallopeptidase family protein [unclassified Aurantimonas]MEC5291409.1 metallopeptidase family protein [Aurantimonas sp. C2-3-R2]MEC5323802.1 metallopeptidase family protein [Aurantimonas sp. A3-2-R12]MEC5381135.1 metallopeptidase family protein [Aurantimonas sp. C2-6-R+9]MEC5412475.1 metallopeptidase family protein [Aurantimonas sp. C2-4-R8]